MNAVLGQAGQAFLTLTSTANLCHQNVEDDKDGGEGIVRDLVARQAPGEPDVTQLMNNPGLAAGAGRAQATQTDLLNYVLQKAFGHKPGLETNPELYAERNSDFLLSEG